MSPEQARGKKDLDHRTDIWSLGVVFYEALAGTTPHGHVDTLGELILQICSTPPRLVQEIAPWVPASVAGIVHKALALDPVHRFASTADMLAAIRAELPSGNNVTESMFVPLSESTRGAAAPKFELTSGIRAPAASYAGVGPIMAQSGDNIGSTMTGVANTRDDKRNGAPMRVVVPVALVLAAVAGLGAWRFASGTRSSEVSSAAPVTATPPTPVESSVPVKAIPPSPAETSAPVAAPAHTEEGPSPAKVAPAPSASAAPVPTAAARPRVARPATAAPPSKAPAGGMRMDMK